MLGFLKEVTLFNYCHNIPLSSVKRVNEFIWRQKNVQQMTFITQLI